MKNLALIVCLLAILTGSLSGCQTPVSKADNEITVAMENDLNNLDPIKVKDIFRIQVIGQIFEGLVGLNGKNEMIPLLAESWSHNDKYTVWTFKLRPGVYFHENACFGEKGTREVTAADVKYSLERTLTKESFSSFVLADAIKGAADFQKGKAPDVSGIKVNNPHEVQVTLNAPQSYFMGNLTSDWIVVMPREAIEQPGKGKTFGVDTLVGTGPYRLTSAKDTEVVLERNPRYWRTTAGNVERIKFKVIKNEQIRYSELRNRRVSIMRVPLPLLPALTDTDAGDGKVTIKPELSQSLKLDLFPTYNIYLLGFNCDNVDPNLRKAVSLAVDRQEILKVTTHGTGLLSCGPLPLNLLGYKPNYQKDIHNQQKAKAALAKVPPQARKLEIVVSELGNSEQLGQLIQNQLKSAGIDASLKKVDFNTEIDGIIKGQYPAFVMNFEWVYSAPEPIISTIFSSSKIPVPNFWHYKNAKVDQELAQLCTMSDRKAMNQIDAAIEQEIIDDAPAVFLYQLNNAFVCQHSVSNLQMNGHNIPLLWEVKVDSTK